MNKLKTIKALKPGKKMLTLMLAVIMVVPSIMYSISASMADIKATEAVPVPVAEGVNINSCFPDENFAKYVYEEILGQNDYAPNGSEYELTSGDVSKITTETTSIDVSEKSIADLTGIENFKALTNLRAYNNENLTEIDISKNTALTNLDVHNTGITELDISKNTALAALNVNNTGITELDLSNNTALDTFEATGTGITELDLLNNEALGEIYVYDTSITKIDVSHLNGLYIFHYYNAKLKSLNLEGKTFGSDYTEISEQNPDFEYEKTQDGKYKILDMPIDGNMSNLMINDTAYEGSLTNDIIVDDVPTKITYDYDTGGIGDSVYHLMLKVTSAKIYNKSASVADEETGISIDGSLEDSASLKVENITENDETYNKLLEAMGEHEEILMSVDVSIVGGTYTPGSAMTLTFSVDPQYNGRTVIIKHLLSDGTIDTYTAIVSDGKVQITVTELSPFMIALAKETQNPNPDDENQGEDLENNNFNQDNENDDNIVSYGSEYQTGDNSPLTQITLIAVTAALACTALIAYRIKKVDYK